MHFFWKLKNQSQRITYLYQVILAACIFSAPIVFANEQGRVSDSGAEKIEEFCNSITDYDFQFFDRNFSLKEWNLAKLNLLKSCKDWSTKKQDSETIKILSEHINHFNRLTTEMPDRMLMATIKRLGPARDQGSVSNCFANAAADLIGHQMGRRVSAFSVLVRSVYEGEQRGFWQLVKRWKDNKSPFTNGEWLIDGMSGSLKGTLCQEDQPNGVQKYTDGDLSQFWENYENGLRVYYGPTPPMKYINPLLALLKKFAPSLNGKDFIDNWKPSENGITALMSWQERNCNLRANSSLKISGQGKSPIETINAGLKKKAPVGFAYRVGFLLNQGDGSHASVIVASMRVKGAMQYLLRNSWGPGSCKHYNPSHSSRCKEGHIWVYESDLKNSTAAAYYYE